MTAIAGLRRRLRLAKWARLLLALGLILTACGTSTDTSGAAPTPSSTLQAQIVSSEILPGTQRVPIGILDQNTPITDATVHVRALLVAGTTAQLKSESDAPFLGVGLEGKGLYVAHLIFDTVGNWLAEVMVQRPDGEHGIMRLPFTVSNNPIVPES